MSQSPQVTLLFAVLSGNSWLVAVASTPDQADTLQARDLDRLVKQLGPQVRTKARYAQITARVGVVLDADAIQDQLDAVADAAS